MGTLSKAVIYLASVLAGIILTFLAAAVFLRSDAPCPAPCDAPAMGMVFSALLLGPVVGLLLGRLFVWWLESRDRAQRR